jgi:hypothetical protein
VAYTKTVWSEAGMSTDQKVNALNHMETQYDEAIAYLNAHTHDGNYYTKTECDSKYFNSSNDGSGSGFVAETLDGYTASQILAASAPSGAIAIWSGSVESIPPGWVLCDGNNGTPDLRDRFVVMVGPTFAPRGAIGGYATRTPSVASASIASTTLTVDQLPAHSHTIPTDYYNNATTGASSGEPGASGTPTGHSETTGSTGGGQGHNHTVSVSCNSYNNRPAYYYLAYIMKL